MIFTMLGILPDGKVNTFAIQFYEYKKLNSKNVNQVTTSILVTFRLDRPCIRLSKSGCLLIMNTMLNILPIKTRGWPQSIQS